MSDDTLRYAPQSPWTLTLSQCVRNCFPNFSLLLPILQLKVAFVYIVKNIGVYVRVFEIYGLSCKLDVISI